jgi:hypothetical protein
MGLKGAPSYFQEAISTTVLGGLMYVSCELYLDDIIVFGRTEEEFVHRLSQVFQRFREYNITVNPDKVTLGVTHIEYVGHLVDSTGHSFSREKIDSVINFSKPITAGALQSFIGLTGYFQTHIKDYQMLTRPLRKMLKDYNKRTLTYQFPTGTSMG